MCSSHTPFRHCLIRRKGLDVGNERDHLFLCNLAAVRGHDRLIAGSNFRFWIQYRFADVSLVEQCRAAAGQRNLSAVESAERWASLAAAGPVTVRAIKLREQLFSSLNRRFLGVA